MKKLLTLTVTAILCFGLISSAFANLPSDTAWEVRTTGDANNGGGYDTGGSGTDYSQQDSAQLALTDLAMTTGGTTLTSATGGFTSAMVDNIIHIVSGTNFTAGFYEITAYTNTNTVTIDRDATNGSNASSGTGNVGGALSKLSDIPTFNGLTGTGNIVWIQDGDYTDSVAFDYANSYDELFIYGYKTTRGDAPTGDDRPLINGGANNYAIQTDCNVWIDSIRFTGGTVETINQSNGDLYLANVKVYSGVIGINCNSHYIYILSTEISTCSDIGIYNGVFYIDYSYIHDCTDSGVERLAHGSGGEIKRSVFDTNGDYGYGNYFRLAEISGNIFYNNTNTGLMCRVAQYDSNYWGAQYYLKVNNIFKDNGGYGCDNVNSSFDFWTWDYNCYEGNTSGGLESITAGSNDITSDPKFTNAAAGDFTLQSGSPCLDAGYQPFSDIGLTGDYTINIGPDQDDNASGGSSEHSYGFVN